MSAYLVGPEGRQQLETTGPHVGDIYVMLTPTRQISVGRAIDRAPGEGEYCAFWTIPDTDDHRDEFDRVYGPFSSFLDRFKAWVFDNANVEPELPCEVVTLDGVSVIKIDLDIRLPQHVVYLPERLVP